MANRIAAIRNGKIVYDDTSIFPIPTETAARESRTDQRNRYRAETLQPNQVDYYRVYPEQAKDLNPELRRLLS